MASIANLAVVLSADSGPITATMESAARKLQQFGDLANSIKSSSFSGMADSLGRIAGIDVAGKVAEWGKMLQAVPGPIGEIATGFFQLLPIVIEVGKAIGTLVGGLVESGRKTADEQMRLSRQFGLTGLQAASMQIGLRAAGTSVDEMRPALTRFQRALAEASGGSIAARGHFDQLGISWERLRQMPVNEQLESIALRFREIQDPAEKARLAMLLFGRSGAQQLEALDKIAQTSNLARNLAASTRSDLSPSDAAQLKGLKDSERMAGAQQKAMQQGITQQLAVAFAPTMTAVNDAWTGSLRLMQPVINDFMGSLKAAGTVFSTLFVEFDRLIVLLRKVNSLSPPGSDKRASPLSLLLASPIPMGSALLEGMGDAAHLTADNRNSTATAEQAAASAALRVEIEQQNTGIRQQIEALGQASNYAQILQLRARGAAEGFTMASEAMQPTIRRLREQGSTMAEIQAAIDWQNEGTIQGNAELHRQLVLRQAMTQIDASNQDAAIQIAGLRNTTLASMSAAEAALRLRLATEGVSQANIEEEASAQRRKEMIAAQLQLMRQQIALSDQWLQQARQMATATEVMTAHPLMTSSQAQRQAQIVETERRGQELQASMPGAGGIFDPITQAINAVGLAANQQRLEALRAADATLRYAEAMERGRQLTESMRNPMEMYNDGVARVNELWETGAIDQTTYERAMMDQFNRLAAATNIQPGNAPQALAAGSVGAMNAISAARREQDANDPQRQVQRVLEDQRAMQAQQLDIQRRTLDALEARGQPVIRNFGAG